MASRRLKGWFLGAAVLAAATSAHAGGPPRIVEPIPYDDALRPDLEAQLGEYNRGPFARADNEVRLDIFFTYFHPEIEQVAKWARQSLQRHPARLRVQFHFVLYPGNPPDRIEADMPTLEAFGAKPDVNGHLADKARVSQFPGAQLAYRQYVWTLRLDEVEKATKNLLAKTAN